MSVFSLVSPMDCVLNDNEELMEALSATHMSSAEVASMEKSDLYSDILSQLRRVSAEGENIVPARSSSTYSLQDEITLSTPNFEHSTSLPSIGLWSPIDTNSQMDTVMHTESQYKAPEVNTTHLRVHNSQPVSSPVLSLLESASAYRSQRCQSLPSTQQQLDLCKLERTQISPRRKHAQSSPTPTAHTIKPRVKAPVYKRVASMGDPSSTMYEIIGDPTPLVQINRRDPEELKRLYICPEGCGSRYEYWRSLQHHLMSKHGLKRKKSYYPQFASLTG